MSQQNLSDPDEPIIVYNSKVRYGLLALLSYSAATVALANAMSLKTEDIAMQYVAAAVAVVIGTVLFMVGFSKKPTLIIDKDGITCSRPNTGLIPWEAVTGLGMSKVTIVRAVLLVALDPTKASEEQRKRWQRHLASGFMNPSVSRFQRHIQAPMTIQIPISFLAISAKRLRDELENKVHKHDGGNSIME